MNETIITLAGWIASDPRLHDTTGGPVLNFRLGATPRRYNKRTNEWYDGETQWHRVNVWRGLAENAHRSLRRGDAVIVHGRLNANTFTTKEGEEVTVFEIEASHVGHDLNRGTSDFRRPRPLPASADQQREEGDDQSEERPAPEWQTAAVAEESAA
ncbi:MAG: single-stranded DNA-binding protein [Nocardioides sp.]|jgi:single-strand DNA-binding protein